MSTSIINIPFPYETPERRLVLSNSQWAADLDVGSSWSTIRFGWRWAAADTGVQMSEAGCYMGMMSTPSANLANGPLSATTGHFVGLGRINANNYNVGVPNYWSTSWVMRSKVGSTLAGSTPASSIALLSSDPSQVRTAHFIEITKGSPNFTLTHVTCAGINAYLDIEELSVLKTAMGQATIANVATNMNAYVGGSGTRYVSSGVSLAVDEATNGYLSAFVIGWPFYNALYVSELLFRVIA